MRCPGCPNRPILDLLRALAPELADKYEAVPCPFWRHIEKDGVVTRYCVASALDGFLSTVACEQVRLTETVQALRNEHHNALQEVDRLAQVHGVRPVMAALASAGLLVATKSLGAGAPDGAPAAPEGLQAAQRGPGSQDTARSGIEA